MAKTLIPNLRQKSLAGLIVFFNILRIRQEINSPGFRLLSSDHKKNTDCQPGHAFND